MGRAPCCDKANVKKGPWSPEEDKKLKEYIETNGTGGNWIALPQKAGLKRCGKSCRLRWLNYLRPNIKHGEFSDDEDKVICTLFASIGSRWSIMAAQLPGRTDNDIKNYWNTKLKKKMMNSLISMPEFRKPFHHLQSCSTKYYSYPSVSSFHNSINNNNAPLSASSSSPPSSYLYSGTNNTISSSFHDHQTLSIPSSPTTIHVPTTISDHNHYPLLQSQDHGYNNNNNNNNNGLGPMESYHTVKDSSTLVMFDHHHQAAAAAASCSSNSDGSCHYEYGSAINNVGQMYDQNCNMASDSYKEFGGATYEKEKGSYYVDSSSMDSSLEEIKQLISTNLCSSNIDNNNNNLNFFVDETKEVEKLMYY